MNSGKQPFAQQRLTPNPCDAFRWRPFVGPARQHKLFFAPAETEIDSYAKLLEQAVPASNKKAWLQELAKLKKGECISVGLHMNEHGAVEQGARVVKVAKLEARL